MHNGRKDHIIVSATTTIDLATTAAAACATFVV
jgi:hypothetical protein